MYGYKKNVDMAFEKAIEKTKEELGKEGFGVLTEIDVKATFKTKLDVDFRRYLIMGVCAPQLAYKALTADPLVGMMLPCNITVEETPEGGAIVNIINPVAMINSIERFNSSKFS